jgi:CBS domain containing-hemolysin-like protein
MSVVVQFLPAGIGLIVLLALSGFFSGSETALFSLSRSQVKRMSDGSRGDRAAHRMLQAPQGLLSTLLVGNMLVNILLTSVTASLIARIAGSQQGPLVTAVNILVATPMLMIFGELTPKTVACGHAQQFSRLAAPALLLFSRFIAPVRLVLRWVTGIILTVLGQRESHAWEMLTSDELVATLAAGRAAGAADDSELELVQRILKLGSIAAHDIMVPRTQVVGVSDELTVREAYEKARSMRYSRLPVYNEDLDGIWGVLATVDLPRWRNSDMMGTRLADLRRKLEDRTHTEPLPVYPIFVVPETARVERLLTDMRLNRAHFVVLVGEYGGTAGILTMNDILEEVVGQVSPPEPDEEKEFVRIGDAVLVDGGVHIREMVEQLGIELTANGADTVGGYVMERLGRLPRTGDEIESEGQRIRVVKMVGRRIGAVRITPLPTPETAEDRNE